MDRIIRLASRSEVEEGEIVKGRTKIEFPAAGTFYQEVFLIPSYSHHV